MPFGNVIQIETGLNRTEPTNLMTSLVPQGRLYTKSSVLGSVLIGCSAPEAGQGHWKEMCRRGQLETARWHTVQPDGLKA